MYIIVQTGFIVKAILVLYDLAFRGFQHIYIVYLDCLYQYANTTVDQIIPHLLMH